MNELPYIERSGKNHKHTRKITRYLYIYEANRSRIEIKYLLVYPIKLSSMKP